MTKYGTFCSNDWFSLISFVQKRDSCVLKKKITLPEKRSLYNKKAHNYPVNFNQQIIHLTTGYINISIAIYVLETLNYCLFNIGSHLIR